MASKYTDEDKATVLQLHGEGNSVAQIVELTGVSKTTVYMWVKEFSRKPEFPVGNSGKESFPEQEFREKVSGLENRIIELERFQKATIGALRYLLDAKIKDLEKITENEDASEFNKKTALSNLNKQKMLRDAFVGDV